jgi:hypothetical protein
MARIASTAASISASVAMECPPQHYSSTAAASRTVDDASPSPPAAAPFGLRLARKPGLCRQGLGTTAETDRCGLLLVTAPEVAEQRNDHDPGENEEVIASTAAGIATEVAKQALR